MARAREPGLGLRSKKYTIIRLQNKTAKKRRVGLDNEELHPMETQGEKNKFYIEHFIESVQTSEDSMEIFNQLGQFVNFSGNYFATLTGY